MKVAARLLKHHGIRKDLVPVNEHTEREETGGLINRMQQGHTCALISDCGMPVFADPGRFLIDRAMQSGIAVEVIPGPTSLTTALAVSGFDAHRFYFYGFLSPKKPERRKELHALRTFPAPVAFLDAPYRLPQVLTDMVSAFGPGTAVCVACDLTLPDEEVYRGTLGSALDHFTKHKRKREFVIIVQPD